MINADETYQYLLFSVHVFLLGTLYQAGYEENWGVR
jgi:hypothetical protein